MSDLTPSPAAAAKPSRKLRIALAVSLALNLAVIGMVAGAMLREGHDFRRSMPRDLGFGPFAEALRPEDRKALRDGLIARAPEIRDARRQMRADTQALLGVLRADPFDPAGLHGLMEAQHNRLSTQLKLGQELLEDFLAAMPPEERRAFVERLEAGLRHGGGADGGKTKD